MCAVFTSRPTSADPCSPAIFHSSVIRHLNYHDTSFWHPYHRKHYHIKIAFNTVRGVGWDRALTTNFHIRQSLHRIIEHSMMLSSLYGHGANCVISSLILTPIRSVDPDGTKLTFRYRRTYNPLIFNLLLTFYSPETACNNAHQNFIIALPFSSMYLHSNPYSPHKSSRKAMDRTYRIPHHHRRNMIGPGL